MNLSPSNKYIPLTLCKEHPIDTYTLNSHSSDCSVKREAFNEECELRDIVYKLNTPSANDYLYDAYTLYNMQMDEFLVIACKIKDSSITVNNIIPDRSEWIVIRNTDLACENVIIGRFIKNILKITGRKQIISLSGDEIIRMFSGEIIITMGMYNKEYQKQISARFLNAYRESIAV